MPILEIKEKIRNIYHVIKQLLNVVTHKLGNQFPIIAYTDMATFFLLISK